MPRLVLSLSLLGLLTACGGPFITQPGNCFEVSHTESSNHGLTYITSIQI